MIRKTIEPRGARDPLASVEQAAVAEETLAVIRHDLRNKISTVRNAVFYMKRRLGGSDASKKDGRIMQFLDMIDAEVIAADGIVIEGRAASRVVGLNPTSASAEACVERAAELTRVGASSVRVELELAPGDIMMSPDNLTMIVRFLIENAIEASPAGAVVALRGAPEGSSYRLDVKDEGCGLPPEAGDSIFEAFFSTKPGHLGLGLSIAARAARRVHGTLNVTSTPTIGVLASLTLPMRKAREAPASAPDASGAPTET